MVFVRKAKKAAAAPPAAKPAATAKPTASTAPKKVAPNTIPGVMYWGCTSAFHKLCLEADQRPTKRPWGAVMEFMKKFPEKAKKAATQREGSLKLTPLAIVCQEAPPPLVQAVLAMAPEAIRIGDRYGELPIHRVALQNRKNYQQVTLKLLRDADPSLLVKQDGWTRTPLFCALESARGVPSPPAINILIGKKGEAAKIANKKDVTPLKLIMDRNDKIGAQEKKAIIKLLEPYYKKTTQFSA